MTPPLARRAALLACASAALLALAGCSDAPGTEAPVIDAEKAAVIEFWKTFNEATVLRRAGRFEDAARLYVKALEHDPRHEDCLYYLGHCRRETGDLPGAREAFERLLEVNPNSARGRMATGALLAWPGPDGPMDLAAAEAHFRRAHEINMEESGPLLRLAEVLLAEGEIDEARKWLRDAFHQNPKCMEAPFLTGYTYWAEGDLARARDAYIQAAVAAQPMKAHKGVLGEGDRMVKGDDGKKNAAPPLEAPMGETLFGEFSQHLRVEDPPQDDRAVTRAALDATYAPLRRFVERLSPR